jgi:hypothetical protein
LGNFPRRDRGDADIVRAVYNAEGRVRGAPPLQVPPHDSDTFMTNLPAGQRIYLEAFLRSLTQEIPEKRNEMMELLPESWLDAIYEQLWQGE